MLAPATRENSGTVRHDGAAVCGAGLTVIRTRDESTTKNGARSAAVVVVVVVSVAAAPERHCDCLVVYVVNFIISIFI